MNIYQKLNQGQTGLALVAILSFIIFLCWSTGLHGQEQNVNHQTLYVVTPSGINLRALPGSHEEKLLVIPYGHDVEHLQGHHTEVLDIMGYVPGKWVYVDYHGLRGYLFDGYLSRFDPNIHASEDMIPGLSLPEMLHEWAVHMLEPVYMTDTAINCESTDPNHLFEQFSHNQSVRVLSTDILLKTILNVHDMKIMEGYHMVMSLLPTKKEKQEYIHKTVIIHDQNGEIHRITVNMGTPVHFIMKDDGLLKISTEIRTDQLAFH